MRFARIDPTFKLKSFSTFPAQKPAVLWFLDEAGYRVNIVLDLHY